MVARRDLHPDPAKRLGRLLAQTRAEAAKNSTGPTGIKHLGAEGDVVWDGPEVTEVGTVNPDSPRLWSIKDVPAAETIARRAMAAANGSTKIVRYLAEPTPETTTDPQTGVPFETGDMWWVLDSFEDRNLVSAHVYAVDSGWTETPLEDAVYRSISLSRLVATDATIDFAVISQLAAELITSELFRTPVDPSTNLYAVMDGAGFRVVRVDSDGTEVTLIHLGVHGENYLQIGEGQHQVTIDSTGTVSAQRVQARDYIHDGQSILVPLRRVDNQIIGSARQLSGVGRQRTSQGVIFDFAADLEVGRVYKIEASSMMVWSRGMGTPGLGLHWTIDRKYPTDPSLAATQKKETNIGAYDGIRSHPGMWAVLDLRNVAPTNVEANTIWLRGAISLMNWNSGVEAQVEVTSRDQVHVLVTDLGTSYPDTGRWWPAQEGTTPPPPPPPAKVRQVTRFHATGWQNFLNGGSAASSNEPRQGDPQNGLLWSTVWLFDSWREMLQGATIHRITLAAWADYTYYPNGGVARWHAHKHYGSMPSSQPALTYMRDSGPLVSNTYWSRGSMQSIDINPANFGWWRDEGRGFGFSTVGISGAQNPRYYMRFSPITGGQSPIFIDIDWEK